MLLRAIYLEVNSPISFGCVYKRVPGGTNQSWAQEEAIADRRLD